MTTSPKPKSRAVRIAFACGVLLALVCPVLPEEYRGVCQAVATVCTGGVP